MSVIFRLQGGLATLLTRLAPRFIQSVSLGEPPVPTSC